jgi:NitT/TauT family transport system substrate-binding protein
VAGTTQISLRVGLPPTIEVGVFRLAQQRNDFLNGDLVANAVTVPDGRAAITSVLGGSLDVAYGSAPDLVRAAATGLPIRLVGPGPRLGARDHTALVAGAETGDEAAAEGYPAVAGTTVAVPERGGMDELALMVAMDRANVELSELTVVTMSPSRSRAALASGDVDFAMLGEPFLTPALDDGSVVVGRPRAELDLGLQQGYWFTSATTHEDRPGAMRRFSAVLTNNAETARELAGVTANLTAEAANVGTEAASRMVTPAWSTEIDAVGLDQIIALMLRYGTIDTSPDAAVLLNAS